MAGKRRLSDSTEENIKIGFGERAKSTKAWRRAPL